MITLPEHHDDQQQWGLGKAEERQAILLLMDHPELWERYLDHLKYDTFQHIEAQYIAAVALQHYEQYGKIPPRDILRDIIKKDITVDDPVCPEILEILDEAPDARAQQHVVSQMLNWIRQQQYMRLYDPETIKAAKRGDYTQVHEIVQNAQAVQETTHHETSLLDTVDSLFEEDDSERYTTGIAQLDHLLNGPARERVMVWVAPTGVGKTMVMGHQALANAAKGHRVLFISLETTPDVIVKRMLANRLQMPQSHFRPGANGNLQDKAREQAARLADVMKIIHVASDSLRPSDITEIIETQRREGFDPEVVIVDYLELMRPNSIARGEKEYVRQSRIANQLVGVAHGCGVCLVTATQTNRQGYVDNGLIDLQQLAGSYDKAMPVDYVVSINVIEYDEDEDKDTIKHIRPAAMYIAKNRHGQSKEKVHVEIDYSMARVRRL